MSFYKNFYKLTYSNYAKDMGFSIAQISTPYGNFVGEAHLHPNDKDSGYSFIGQALAENRAVIKYFKHRITLINRDIRTTNQIYSEINNKAGKKVKHTDTIHLAYGAILDYRKRLEKQKEEFERNIGLLEKANESFKNTSKKAEEILRSIKVNK